MRSKKSILKPFFVVFPAFLLLLLLSFGGVSAQAQQQDNQNGASSQPQSQQPASEKKPDDTANAKATQPASPEDPRQAQQAHYVADSQKLYQLAQELKSEVAKTNKNTLSITVTKKAEEIEKLAKSMKERMRKEQ